MRQPAPSDPGAIFGRDVPDAPWRPSPELLAESRAARLLRALDAPDLETLQARAVADPGWFWGAAVDDLGLAWQRKPKQTLDIRDGIEWARWWIGGAFNHGAASVDPWAELRPGAEAVAWGGARTARCAA